MADLRGLLNTVNLTGAGRLYWLCARTSPISTTLLATNGNQLFPGMTPLGGEMLGLPALVSRAVPNVGGSPATDSLLLIDAAQIAADAAQIEIDMSNQAALAMDSAPGMNALVGTGASTVSLFQSNCTALMAKVWFGAARLRTSGRRRARRDHLVMTRERIALIERRLMRAIMGRDGPTATALQRELAMARSSTTVLDFADFRAALLKGTLRGLVPTRGFKVRASREQMADLAKQLCPQPRKGVDRARKHPHLNDPRETLLDAIADIVTGHGWA